MDSTKDRKCPKFLPNLALKERRQFIDSFDQVMVDCDGCIWTLLSPIEGAGKGLRALQSAKKRIIYVSNNSVRSVENFREQLEKVGLQLDERDLVNSVIAIVHYLRKINFEGKLYVVGSIEMRKRLRNEGFDILFGPDEPLEEHFPTLLNAVSDMEPVKAVIFDVEFNYNYVKYMRAQKYLKDPQCILIAGATDRKMSLGKDLDFAGPGPFFDMLHSHSPPIVLGKPGAALAEVLKDKYRVENPKRVLFIGDTLEQDILFGNNNQFQTMLVLTGATSKDQLLEQTDESLLPDYFSNSLGDLVQLLRDFDDTSSSE